MRFYNRYASARHQFRGPWRIGVGELAMGMAGTAATSAGLRRRLRPGDVGRELQGVAAEMNSAVMDADHPDEGIVSAALKQLQAAALVHRDAVRGSGG